MLRTQYPANKSTMNTNLIQTPQVTKTDEGLLVNSGFTPWDSGDNRFIIDYIIIGDNEVKVGVSGHGKCILLQGLENEAEYQEFDFEDTFSFEALGIDADFFDDYGSDAVNELIYLTEKAVKDEY